MAISLHKAPSQIKVEVSLIMICESHGWAAKTGSVGFRSQQADPVFRAQTCREEDWTLEHRISGITHRVRKRS